MARPVKTITRSIIAAALCLSAATSVSTASAADGGDVGTAPADGSATDQVIVTFDRPGRRLGSADIERDAGNGARDVRGFDRSARVIKLPQPLAGDRLEAVMERLARRPGVQAVTADQVMHLSTNDEFFGDQWDLTAPATSGVQGIDVETAWSIEPGSSGIRVAVIDTGYLPHADLAGRVIGGYDFISDSRIGNDGNGRDADASDPGDWITSQESRRGFFRGCQVRDSSWHGTHVAGTIGAATNNNQGIAGINQNSQIVPVRVLGKCGGYTTDIVDGMRWAAGLSVSGVPANAHPADVLSLSLGGGGACSSIYQNAIDDITAAGAVVVVAAGNSDADAAGYSPASCDDVITVAATGKAGDRSYYSNYGSTIEIAAPGGDRLADDGDTILSTLNTGTRSPQSDAYVRYQGTSMATPHVSGVVSLMLSADPSLTPVEVVQLLQQSARPFPGGSTCAGICGAGLLDAGAAVAAAAGVTPPTSTSTTTTSTTTSTTTTTTTSTTSTSTSTTSTVAPSIPGSFSKLSPDDGADRLGKRVTMQWSPSSGADHYEVCIDSTLNSTCAGGWSTVFGTSAAVNGLDKGTAYEWQVQAVNSLGTTISDGGAWFTFTTR